MTFMLKRRGTAKISAPFLRRMRPSSPPRFVSAGQSAQVIIGPGPDFDVQAALGRNG
jgi:predicted DNA-binding helix-hairpin-helix protein